MTLSTNVYVLDPVDVREVFRFCQGMLTKYDDDRRTPDQQIWTDDHSSWRGGGTRSMRNQLGQGLPGILDVTYRVDEPLCTPEQAAQCTEDCEPPEDYHHHPRTCWLDIDFDTAYGARFDGGMGCGDLHAALVAELGQWLDAKGVRWEWHNEFTGEVHGGDDRYERLIDLCRDGFEAAAWFRTSALPAILAHIAGDTDERR